MSSADHSDILSRKQKLLKFSVLYVSVLLITFFFCFVVYHLIKLWFTTIIATEQDVIIEFILAISALFMAYGIPSFFRDWQKNEWVRKII